MKGGDHALDVKIEFAAAEFFAADPKKLQIEENEWAGRVYILKNGRIVAVAQPRSGEAYGTTGRHLCDRKRRA